MPNETQEQIQTSTSPGGPTTIIIKQPQPEAPVKAGIGVLAATWAFLLLPVPFLSSVVAGVLSLVFDHHTSNLSQRLTSIQHDFHTCIIASLHVHLDHENCLETLVLKGEAQVLRELAQRLISTKGVKHGSLNLAATGQDLF